MFAAVDAEDRICRLLFGVGTDEASEDRLLEVATYLCDWDEHGDEHLRCLLTRDAMVAICDVGVSFQEIDRLEDPSSTRLMTLLTACMRSGTAADLTSLADALEPWWHDNRLSSDAVVRLVERTEALRGVAKRLQASGLETWDSEGDEEVFQSGPR